MQVSIISSVPAPQVAMPAKAQGAAAASTDPEQPTFEKRVDFSRITPRQLQAYINERIFSNSIDPDEATSIMNQLGATQMQESPDVPFDLRARLNGTMEFHMDAGDGLAAWYEGLINLLDVMEAQSVFVSAMA